MQRVNTLFTTVHTLVLMASLILIVDVHVERCKGVCGGNSCHDLTQKCKFAFDMQPLKNEAARFCQPLNFDVIYEHAGTECFVLNAS